MRIYYRGPDAVVTSTVFAGRAPAPRYAIRDLRNVQISRVERFEPSVAHAAAGLLIIAAVAWPLWQASPLYALALVALGMPALAAGTVMWRLRPQTFQLRATYRGAAVELYSSGDERVFNQITRALRRAIEDARPPAVWTGADAA
ncbi:hypothetical protein DMB66_13205 [Actinoplanes sp. ATCC 53533]|uniref:DUF6232 family protein n=1 Tax=Actinoplanes sp. ATCC 53533 TaxID=1288362 RepID=UPI000F7B3E27|nr:DUF6232 family protein [Actinoplanes sp. ATCC 53533]RSM68445.1 hypothetical protein DMB66_13205 [Actinoplanes sp. ATCC 53533]